MSDVPSNLIPTRITQLPVAPVADENSLMMIVYQGNNYQIRVGDLLSVAGVPTSRQVIAGTGMTGGGQLTSNITLSVAPKGVNGTLLSDTGVASGVYGDATNIPVFTVDSTGRVTAATTIPATISGYVPTSTQVIAGNGLTGGGALSGNVTLTADFSSASPQAGFQTGSAGVATTLSRGDHKHPAVDLSADDQVDNILGLNNGGTARSLVMQPGAVIWSGADGLYVGPAGVAGQVLLSGGTSQYTWSNQSGLNVGQANNINGGAANKIAYQSATDVTAFIDAPTFSNTLLKWNGTGFEWGTIAGAGTVTSVGLTLPSDFTVTGSPVTSAGVLAGSWASQTANKFLASPNGSTGTPSFRAMVAADVPTLNQNTTGTAGSLAGGATGSVPYQTSSGVTTFLAAGTGVLVGGSAPSYSTTPTLTGTNFSGIPNGALTNSAVTLGTTSVSLGATSLTLGGLTSVAVTQDPVSNFQVATKQYVDGLVTQGISYHSPVYVEVPSTTGNLNATYNNGTAGVGATLTNAGTQAAFTADGIAIPLNSRVLIYNQTNQFENGVYTLTTVGDGSTNWVLTRATDADTYGLRDPDALGYNDAFFVTNGNTGAGETYVCTTSGVITFGTTAITFAQISSSQVYSAGTGLTLTGTQFSLTAPVVVANGGTGLTSFTAGDLPYYTSGTALSKLGIGSNTYMLTSNGSAPGWTDPASVTVGNATAAVTATNVTGGAAGSIVYQSGAATTTTLALGTTNYVLTAGASAPQYVAQSTLSVGSATTATTATSATTATNLAGGAASQIPYQTGSGATAFLANGTAGQVLRSAGSSAPNWGGVDGGTF
jgi:hypothetical protein